MAVASQCSGFHTGWALPKIGSTVPKATDRMV